jgi:hypothetical protein
LRKPDRKQKDTQTIHVMGKMYDLMMGGVLVAKYSDMGNPLVNVQINNTLISNTLIDLAFSTNVMKHDTMQYLGLTSLRETQTLLHLADISTIK